MPQKLHIRNWSRFQHYKDRNPPWIQLHREIFASEDWTTLADASKLLMVVCIVLGARDSGNIPNNPDYIMRVAYLKKRPNLTPLIECGFLEILQADASKPYQTLATARPETYREETETEQRRKKESPPSPSATLPPKGGGDISQDFEIWWNEVPRKVGKGQARKAFKTALKKASLEELLAGIRRYAVAVRGNGKEPEYICHPSTWLNGERWLDEPEKSQRDLIDEAQARAAKEVFGDAEPDGKAEPSEG